MMSAILGIFTRHLVTKFVALLLAVVLFVFTQQGISDTQRIKQIVVTFELSPEASVNWVLMQKQVLLKNMTVQGLRDTLTREIAGLRGLDFRKTIVIDEEFLRRHSTEQKIRLDAAFCETEEIPWKLAKDFRLVVPEVLSIEIAPRIQRTFRLELTDEMKAMLDLPENFKFRGRGGAVRPSIKLVGATSIAISGPQSALPPQSENPDDPVLPLYVTIRPLTEILQGTDTLAAARDKLAIDGIDWHRSGFRIPLRSHVVIESPRVSQGALRNEIWIRCDLEERRTSIKLKLPILFMTGAGSLTRQDLVDKKYSYVGKLGMPGQIFGNDDQWGFVEGFELEVAQTWAKRGEDLMKYLAVRIDFTNVEKRGKVILVPLEIVRLKGPADLNDTVRIARNDDNESPGLQFRESESR